MKKGQSLDRIMHDRWVAQVRAEAVPISLDCGHVVAYAVALVPKPGERAFCQRCREWSRRVRLPP